jgi:hypothetical protein
MKVIGEVQTKEAGTTLFDEPSGDRIRCQRHPIPFSAISNLCLVNRPYLFAVSKLSKGGDEK